MNGLGTKCSYLLVVFAYIQIHYLDLVIRVGKVTPSPTI